MTRVRQVCFMENCHPEPATALVSEGNSLGPRPERGVGLVLFLRPCDRGSMSGAGFGAPLFLVPMPTLDWIGKKAVVNHHREVPYRLLHCDKGHSAGDADAGNLLVQGDNLLALKALLPYYAGKVKCIYIDPPYNTGKEGWIYNDSVNSPEIKRWLGQVVGKEAEDLSRHDKWLCMIYPRVSILREFLSDDGV